MTAILSTLAPAHEDVFLDTHVEKLGPTFGAIVQNLDLREIGPHNAPQLRELLLQHKVLFFKNQSLTDTDQVALGNHLGQLTAGHPVAPARTAHEEIYDIDSSDPDFSFSDVWHTDVTFVERPPAASILRAVELPDFGGDTSWANSQAAYESLAKPIRDLVDKLSAVHDGNREWGAFLRRLGGGNTWDGEKLTELKPVVHPVVRIHPETGRKGLFVNPGFTSHIVGVSDAESRGILDLLYSHLTQPENTIRHRWSAGDVGIWDNRCTSHYANRDYSAQRVMRRVTLQGDEVVGPYVS